MKPPHRLYVVVRLRRDNISQRYHVLGHDLHELQAYIGVDKLAPSGLVGNDTLLRQSSPRAIVKAVMAALYQRDPITPPVPVTLLTSKAKVSTWQHQHPRFGPQDGRASYTGHEVLILPRLYRDLKTPDMETRARVARTLGHEHWHALKGYAAGHHPFEEGGAEVYADDVMQELLDLTPFRRVAYTAEREAVLALRDRFGQQWLSRSRQARDQPAYLKAALDSLHADPREVARVLSYTSLRQGEQFRDALLDLLRR